MKRIDQTTLETIDNEIQEDAIRETRELVRRHRAGCSNEVLAAIAFEAFEDIAGGTATCRQAFCDAFPTLGLFV